MGRPVAALDWTLYVECPKCEQYFDLVPVDAENGYILAKYIFDNDWTLVEGHEVTCPRCNHEFELGGVDY